MGGSSLGRDIKVCFWWSEFDSQAETSGDTGPKGLELGEAGGAHMEPSEYRWLHASLHEVTKELWCRWGKSARTELHPSPGGGGHRRSQQRGAMRDKSRECGVAECEGSRHGEKGEGRGQRNVANASGG